MLRSLTKMIALLTLVATFVFPLFAQSHPVESSALDAVPIAAAITIKTYVREVSLVLSVTDRKGRFVENLGPSDFSVLDNDQKQEVLTFFQSETDPPLRVALLLDTSSSVADKFRF